jgi:hypothetical protein
VPGNGGRSSLSARNGNAINNKELKGGNGGDKLGQAVGIAGDGGPVEMTGLKVINNGDETGGNGGDGTQPGHNGGNGGNATNESLSLIEPQTPGATSGGKKGDSVGAANGVDGKVLSKGPQANILVPGDRFRGGVVALSTQPSGYMSMAMMQAGTLQATTRICISGFGAPIDLTGISAGTIVMSTDAGGSIQIQGPVTMDSGVTLADIAEPDPQPFLDNECLVDLAGTSVGGSAGLLEGPDPAARSSQSDPEATAPLATAAALIAGLALLGGSGWYVRRRFGRN